MKAWLPIAVGAALLSGCNVEWRREHPLGCRLDEQRLIRDTLYFGASIPGGSEVDGDTWLQFETDTLTPAFPDGYTIIPAHGLWRGADATTTTEASRVVIVVHPDTPAAAAAVRDVASRYRERFHQQSVLHEYSVVCAQF